MRKGESMSQIQDRLPLLIESYETAANTGRLSDQEWEALDRRLQVAVFEAVAGRPPPPHGVIRDRGPAGKTATG